MASDGGGAIGSTFFEVRLDDIPPEEPKPEKQKGTGGMSFNVDLGKFEWIQEFKFLQEFTFFLDSIFDRDRYYLDWTNDSHIIWLI